MMILAERQIKKAYKSYGKALNDCDNLLDEIKNMLSFEHEDMNVFHQRGDGLVLEFDSKNIPVEFIVNHFKIYGQLSIDDLLIHCI